MDLPDTRQLWDANAAAWTELTRQVPGSSGSTSLSPFIRAATGHGGGHDSRRIRYVLGDGCVLPFGASVFDGVTAFMSLMDVAVPEQALHEMARVLRPGSFAQFSISHPAITTPLRRWLDNESGDHAAVAVGEYFGEGPVTETWTFETVPDQVRAQHRPFTITFAHRTLASWPAVAATRVVPHFLIIAARKP